MGNRLGTTTTLPAVRAEELIRTERDRIVIVDPVQLARAQGWNQSP